MSANNNTMYNNNYCNYTKNYYIHIWYFIIALNVRPAVLCLSCSQIESADRRQEW